MSLEAWFWKFYCEGNSYVVVDDPECLRSVVGAVNDQARGVGGDGVLLAEWRQVDTIGMRVFNADGTEAPMCGNGARALVTLAVIRNPTLTDLPVTIEAGGGTAVGRAVRNGPVFDSEITIDAPQPTVEAAKDAAVYRVQVGVPHLVVFGDTSTISISEDGPRWEHSVPGGTNVMFATVAAPGLLDVIPWERGVGAVLGCATGGAAAIIAASSRDARWPTTSVVRQPGGCIGVQWHRDTQRLTLRGSVRLIARGFVYV